MFRALIILFCAFLTFAAKVPKSQVVTLNEDNWQLMLKDEWMVEFHAPWCPACKNLAPTWDEFSSWSHDLNIQIAKIDITTSPALSGRFLVSALPTIFHVINSEFRQYRGARDLQSLMSFVEEKKWSSVEPISSWKNPDSIFMSIVSYFFKLSHYLKETNNYLRQEYGLPVWGSYAIFAIATVLIGAMLGLILVGIIDFIYPPKNVHRQSFSETKEKSKHEDGVQEISGDELEDDGNDEEESTSDGEKYSGSDSETQEIDKKNSENSHDNSEGDNKKVEDTKSSPKSEVRKRKQPEKSNNM